MNAGPSRSLPRPWAQIPGVKASRLSRVSSYDDCRRGHLDLQLGVGWTKRAGMGLAAIVGS